MTMDNLPQIVEKIHTELEARTKIRDVVLEQCRSLTRHAAHAIRAVHRSEYDLAREHLADAQGILYAIRKDLEPYPDMYYAGYTQDALKEFVEASVTLALIQNQTLPTPEQLEVEYSTFLNGLAEAVGELRRRCLDILRAGYSQEAERLLTAMDDIYSVLVTMDYPDGITNGLRRQTDLVRGILERTRGDLTISLREQQLQFALENTLAHLPPAAEKNALDSSI
jgi:translin